MNNKKYANLLNKIKMKGHMAKAVALAMCFVLFTTSVDITALAYTGDAGSDKEIVGISSLSDAITNQKVNIDATLEDIKLPESLDVHVSYQVEKEIEVEVEEEKATPTPTPSVEPTPSAEPTPSVEVKPTEEPKGEEVKAQEETNKEDNQKSEESEQNAPADEPTEESNQPDDTQNENPESQADGEQVAKITYGEYDSVETVYVPMTYYAAEPSKEEVVVETLEKSDVADISDDKKTESKTEIKKETVIEKVEEDDTVSVTWAIDEENSSRAEFKDLVAGEKYIFVPTITEDGYKLADDVDLPVITVTVDENQAAFEKSVTVDGVVITVTADEGVFPEDATIEARKVTTNEEKEVEEAIDEVRDDAKNVALSYTFDITAYDKDGNEIEPDTSKGSVKVTFKMAEIANENLETDVYHVEETDDGLNAEGLAVTNKGANTDDANIDGTNTDGGDASGSTNDEITVETTGFSFYTVEFTYGELQYVLEGDERVELTTILDAVGIKENGEISKAEGSDDELIKPVFEDDVWYIEALKAFNTEEWLKVTIGGIEYEIVVTDDQAEDYYPVWIGGTQISRSNKDDVLGDGGKKVSFDPETNTLTLSGAAICTGAENNTTGDAIYCNLPAGETLTINLNGSNVIGKVPSAEWENFNIASGISSKEADGTHGGPAKLLLKGDEDSSLTIYAGESGIKGSDISLGEEGENFEGKLKIYSLKTGIHAGEEPTESSEQTEGEITIYGGDIDIESKENGLFAMDPIKLSDVTLNVTANPDLGRMCYAINAKGGLNITGSAFHIVARLDSDFPYYSRTGAIFCPFVTKPEGTKIFGSTEWDAPEESITREAALDDFSFKMGDDYAKAVILHICSVEQKSGQAATCTEDGWKDYYQCTNTSCSKIYASSSATGTSYADLDEWKASPEGKIESPGHNWIYTASGAALTATCGRDASHTATLTLTASDANYSGNPVTVCTDGTNADAVIKYNLSDWTTAGAEAVTVKYVGRDGTTYDESATAPTKIGKYAVKLYPASEEETRIHVATANFEITRMTDYDGKLIDFADTNWEYKFYTSGSFTSNVAGDTSGTLEKLKFYNISGAPVSYVGASFTATPDSHRSNELTPSMIAGLISSVTNGVGVTCAYNASDHKLTITPIVHTHDWKYSATGNKLKAYCANAGCPSGTDADHKVSLTLTATSANYSGSTTGWCEADKVAFELVGKDAWESAVGTAPTIQYTGTTIDGTAYTSEDKPAVGGRYTAYIECDEKKAELSFLVGHVFEGQPYVDVEDGIHHNQKCKYCDNVNQGNHDFSDEGICKNCNCECTHQNAEGWTVEDGKCTSCGVEIGYPVDDEGKPVVIDKVPDQLWVTGIRQNLKFTGAKVEQPTMKVYWKNKLLVINQDYSVKYLNNIKAGTATVVITGKGNYAGTIKETYPIEQIDIGSAKAFDEEITIAANGKIQKPTTTFTIEAGGKTVTLKNGTDYTYTYPVIKDKGEYEVTITGKGNYKGTKTVKVTVVDEGVAVTKLTVKKIPNQTYRDEDSDGKGDQIIPDVVVMYGKKILEKGTDYTVEAAGANTDIGTGTVTIVGNSENGYYGKRNISFNIVGTPITKATVEGLVTETYTGNAINPTGYKLYFKATKTTGQIDLTENKDYKVSVDKNVNAGTATVTFTGINGYSGVLKKTFKINKASMTDERISIKPIDAAQYQKNGAKPAITVTDGSRVLKENVDYTVKYTNNNALHDLSNEVKKPTVTITGKGNYVGTKSANFAIIGSSLSKDDITITATDIVASGKANTCKPVIKLTDNGVALKAGTDYETAVEYTYVNATKVKQIVNRVETEVEYAAGAKVNTADIIPAGTEIRATVKGKGFYADSKEVVFRYVAANIASAKVVIPSFVYSGKAITLDENKIQVTMVVNKKAETLKFGEDFEIIGYKNNVDKGTAKVTIRGLGNYGGTKEVTFKIVSKTLNHTVRLHNNDGSGKDVVREINIPSGTMLPVNKFKVAGKKFAGWNTEADGSGEAYDDREAIVRSNLSMLIFGDTLDLYAQWE